MSASLCYLERKKVFCVACTLWRTQPGPEEQKLKRDIEHCKRLFSQKNDKNT